jgi:hypothetical protein
MSKTLNPNIPLFLSAALVTVGVALGLEGGISNGSLWGGVCAALGVIPAAWACWGGMQLSTQRSLALAIIMVYLSLGVAGLLTMLWLINWMRG